MIEVILSTHGLVGTGKSSAAVVSRIMDRFQKEAAPLIVSGVQSVLGHSELYQLSPEWSEHKPRDKRFVRFPGTDDDQPLIFTGQMYHSVEVVPSGPNLALRLIPDAAQHAGFDYGARWEEETHFLEAGLAVVVDQLPDILLRIICEEMSL